LDHPIPISFKIAQFSENCVLKLIELRFCLNQSGVIRFKIVVCLLTTSLLIANFSTRNKLLNGKIKFAVHFNYNY